MVWALDYDIFLDHKTRYFIDLIKPHLTQALIFFFGKFSHGGLQKSLENLESHVLLP